MNILDLIGVSRQFISNYFFKSKNDLEKLGDRRKSRNFFFTEDEAPRRASNHGQLCGNYRDKYCSVSVNYFRIKQVSIEFYRVNTRSLIYFQYCLNSYVSIRKVNGGIYWYLITSMVFDVAIRWSSGGMEDVKRFSFIRRIWFHRIRKIRNTRWFKVIELWSNQYKLVYNVSRD